MNEWKQLKQYDYPELLEAAMNAKQEKNAQHKRNWTETRAACQTWAEELDEYCKDRFELEG